MKAPKPSQYYLKSSFVTSGELKIQINELHSRLQSLPILKLTKASEPKTFSIMESDGSSKSDLQVMGNKLIFNYRFHKSSTREYAKNLLKFITILAYIGDLYEPQLPSLYPSIMEVLVGYVEEMPYASIMPENGDLLVRQVQTLSAMNCSLSIQIIQMKAELKNLKLKNNNLARFARDAMESAMARGGVRNPDSDSMPKIIGTSSQVYNEVKTFVFEKKVKN